MSDHISSQIEDHGLHISHMKPQDVKVQRHCVNESYLVTVPNSIARAIQITKGNVLKAILDNNKRLITEKV